MVTTYYPAPYTVLLARPDMTGDVNLDTYLTTVWCGTVDAAVATARFEACSVDHYDKADAMDYAVLLVIAGDCPDINPER